MENIIKLFLDNSYIFEYLNIKKKDTKNEFGFQKFSIEYGLNDILKVMGTLIFMDKNIKVLMSIFGEERDYKRDEDSFISVHSKPDINTYFNNITEELKFITFDNEVFIFDYLFNYGDKNKHNFKLDEYKYNSYYSKETFNFERPNINLMSLIQIVGFRVGKLTIEKESINDFNVEKLIENNQLGEILTLDKKWTNYPLDLGEAFYYSRISMEEFFAYINLYDDTIVECKKILTKDNNKTK